jgi:predicted transcriptional regulator
MDNDQPENKNKDLLALTSQIVSSYVANNTVAQPDISELIKQVHGTLLRVEKGDDGSSLADRPQPAVPIKKSIQPDYLVCLEDGKKLKMMKRHLKTGYDMTPNEYRERWGLPKDYPMVAPNYAKRRSELAKDIGLGVVGR